MFRVRTTAVALACALGVLTVGAGPVLAAPVALKPPTDPATGLPWPSVLPGVPSYYRPVASPELAAAQQAAEALQTKVDALQVRTEQAVEHYNQVAADLLVAEDQHQKAALELGLARAAKAEADRIANLRVRSLYITGGPPGLGELTVGGEPASELLNRFDDTRFVARQDRLYVQASIAAARRAAAAESALAAALDAEQQLERRAAAVKKSVRARLAEQKVLLATASAQVKQLLADQQQAQAASAAALATMVRSAQQRAGGLGVGISTTTTAASLSPFARTVLAGAEAQLGKPYVWGATGPSSYDCSGLTMHAFAVAGVQLPRTSRQQWFAGSHPSPADVQPGDLLFWASNISDPGTIHHVAIYIGDGYMIAAPHTGSYVRVQPVYTSGFFGVTRIAAPVS